MKEDILTPVGRLVMGSLYTPNTKDMQGKPMTYEDGSPKVEYWIHLAVQKGGEQHWSQTPWGQIIHRVGSQSFPNGQFNLPTFSWKVEDGDSTIPNNNGNKPCDNEGYKAHWILKFKTGYAPVLVNMDATPFLLPEGSINCGDYIQVFGFVADNKAKANQVPGVALRFTHVAFAAYGERIHTKVDPKSIGFGGALPAGAKTSPTPMVQGFAPVTPATVPPGATLPHNTFTTPVVMPSVPQPQAAPIPAPVAPQPAPAPYTAILKPKQMTALANGIPYEEFLKQNWTDELLIAHGYMLP